MYRRYRTTKLYRSGSVAALGPDSLLPAPLAPTLTWTSGATDNQPDFSATGDLDVDDVGTIYAYTDVGLTTLEDTGTGVVTVAGTLTITNQLGPLTDGTKYCVMRTARSGHHTSGNSNTETKTIDATAPTLSSNTASQLAQTTASLSVTTNEANGTLYRVVSKNLTTPSAAQVKAGHDQGGAAPTDGWVNTPETITTTGAKTATATGLIVATYKSYAMHEDAVGNQSTVSASSSWSQADITAPVLTSAVDTQTGSTTANIGATTDEASGYMYVAATPTSTPPSDAQIIAGTGGGIVAAANSAVASTGAKLVGVTGLTASTPYYGHIIQVDAANNTSNGVTGDGFTTDSAGFDPLTLFSGGAGGTWLDPSDSAKVWQDSALTTPAVSSDPLGGITDKSGNSNNATQAASGKRPTLAQDGGLWYFLTDGTDDFLRATFTTTQPWYRFSAIRIISIAAGSGQVFGGVTGNVGALYASDSTHLQMYSGSAGPTGVFATSTNYVITEYFNGASSYIRINRTETTGNPGTTEPGGITISASNSGTDAPSIRCYGLIMTNKVLGGTDVVDAETWLAAKAGVTL